MAGEPSHSVNLSLALSNVRGLVCTPIWGARNAVMGMIYVDWSLGSASPQGRVLPRLQEIVLKLERFLCQVEKCEGRIEDPFTAAVQPAPVACAASLLHHVHRRRWLRLPNVTCRESIGVLRR